MAARRVLDRAAALTLLAPVAPAHVLLPPCPPALDRLLAGAAVAYDLVLDDGGRWRDYLLTDGERWLLLEFGSMNPPEDHWRSIADSVEFLPAAGSARAEVP